MNGITRRARELGICALLQASLIGITLTQARAAPVRGTVLDVESLAGVPNANVSAGGARATTEEDGTFELDLPTGSHKLIVRAEGYDEAEQETNVGSEGLRDVIVVAFKVGAENETIIVNSFDALSLEKSVAGHTELSREELTKSPGTRGDALHGVRNLPGVANIDPFTPGAFAFGLVIRGSSPDDSKYMVNGIELPILYHFFGLQSIMPSEMIEDIEFIPGGFDVQYGNSTAGIVNIHTRVAKSPTWSGFTELSFVSASGFLEGPISKDHNVWMSAGFRRSIIDALVPLALPDDLDLSFTTLPQYYDSQLRIDWDPSPKHNLMLMGFTSWDFASGDLAEENPLDPNATGEFDNTVGFSRLALSYHYASLDTEVFARGWLGNASFEFSQGTAIFQDGKGLINGATTGVRHKLLPWLQLRSGAEYQSSHIDVSAQFPLPPSEGQPGVPNSTTDMSETIDRLIKLDVASAYVAADADITDALSLTTGLRYDNFVSGNTSTLSPRGTLRYEIGSDWGVSGSVGRYTLQSRGFEGFRNDLGPEESNHYVVGVEHRLDPGVELTITGFAKDSSNLIVYDPNRVVEQPSDGWVNRGTGFAKGLETMLRVRRENWFGWLSYSLQRSERNDGNGAPDRLFDFDQTHNLVLVGSYKYRTWRFGARFQFATGEPDTPIASATYDSDVDAYRPNYGAVNSIRKASAHQLDARIERQWEFERWRLSAYLDVTNVYAHARPIAKSYNFNYSESEDITTIPIFPAVGLRGSF